MLAVLDAKRNTLDANLIVKWKLRPLLNALRIKVVGLSSCPASVANAAILDKLNGPRQRASLASTSEFVRFRI